MVASLVSLLSLVARQLTPLSIMVRERTFIAVKPDGVQRGLVGEIIKRFEAKGFKLAGMKYMQATEDHLKKHYADLADKPFYPGLCKYMSSGPLVAMCWEGTGVVTTARNMMGETRPADSKPGTIRGDFCIEVGRNIIHGSDSVESANKEIALWFSPGELVSWTQANETWIYESKVKNNLDIEYENDCGHVLWLMAFFGDKTTACGLQTLNDFLQDRSYIRGYTPSQVDAEVFSSLAKAPEDDFCHVLRWYNHIKSLGVELRLTGENLTTITALPENITNEDEVTKISNDSLLEDKEITSKSMNDESKDTDDDDDNDDDDDDEEIDLFGSSDEGDDREAARVREERLRAYAEKKSKKPGPIAKSSIMLDVKPWDDETNMSTLEELVRSIRMDGLQWGASKLAPLAFGINKLSILCTVEDEKVSVDDLTVKICDFEDTVQSVDIAAFNKI
ncbi:elongation factor 1-beta-like [Homarus americanus]|nr:elongation factor 1-beta-like [Homarus americanus]